MAEDYFGIVGTTQAGAYRVEAVVAEGGFGVVYRAFHDAFQAHVALKCLKIPVQMNEENQREFLDKFKGEAALLFRLSASISSVVRPLHVDRLTTPDGRFVPFMALEWLDGEGLDALVERRAAEGLPPLGLKKVVRMLAPVARALARAHHFPGPDGPIAIVHRDVKPDNIFIARVNGEEVVKIFDFGIAQARSVATQVAGRLSQSNNALAAFTPGYGAPEQWMPKRYGQTGPWTDVFGLALTVLEAAVGRPIIDGDTAAMMGTVCDEQRRPTPRAEGLEVNDVVEAVFLSALAVDPRDRYPDAGTFWDALESALGIEQTATPTLGGGSSRASDDTPPSNRHGRGAGRAATPAEAGLSRKGAGNRSGIEMLELEVPSGPAVAIDIADVSSRAPSSGKMTPAPARPSRGAGEPPSHRAGAAGASGAWGAVNIIDNAPPSSRGHDFGGVRSGSAEVLIRPASGANVSGGFARMSASEAAAVSRAATSAHMAARSQETPHVMSRIKTPLLVAGVGMLMLVLDQMMLQMLNASLAIGPVRLVYVLGVLLTVGGVILVLKRLITPE